jgi:putative N6-adenine-specific DNA methylase
MSAPFEILLVTAPGLESPLAEEAAALGLSVTGTLPGGVTVQGGWPDVWRANYRLRGAARVLARIGSFRAFHLAQLDKRSRKFPWGDVLRPDVPVRIEVTTKASKIYHAKAAAQRVEKAIAEELGAPISPEAEIIIKLRIDDNLCEFSVDTTGESLHKRGHKEAVGKAPMRENLAAMFLRQCGYAGAEPVVDPMCGSGTFVIEAAEIAAGLAPGRSRGFAFEKLASFDAAAFAKIKADAPRPLSTGLRFFGSDRDSGAIRMAKANAERAGVADVIDFGLHGVSELKRPEGAPGLVMVNPPYGARIGERKLLYAVYGALGKTLLERFSGWRVGIVTSDAALAHTTGLPFLPAGAPVSHSGLRITLFQTAPLP